MRPDRTAIYHTAPLFELLGVFLRQFKRPLAARGFTLTDADALETVQAGLNGDPLTMKQIAMRAALCKLIDESEAVLAGMKLTFEGALRANMETVPGWETTAEFLELANQKSNAELRIAAGSVVVTALGDDRYRHHLNALIARGEDDLETVVAQRLLAHLDGSEA